MFGYHFLVSILELRLVLELIKKPRLHLEQGDLEACDLSRENKLVKTLFKRAILVLKLPARYVVDLVQTRNPVLYYLCDCDDLEDGLSHCDEVDLFGTTFIELCHYIANIIVGWCISIDSHLIVWWRDFIGFYSLIFFHLII